MSFKTDTVTTQDGVKIFFKDWGEGQPIVFHHGWPLSCDDWDTQMLFFVRRGYRVVGIDRRGHGRSSQVSDGHDMTTTPPTRPQSSNIWTCARLFISATPPAGAKPHVTSRVTARVGLRSWCWRPQYRRSW